MTRPRILFPLIFAALVAARLCHAGVLWAEENLPLAAAVQMLAGKTLYRDVCFDKPPLLAAFYVPWGAPVGALLRIAGAAYGLLAAALAWGFARDLWGDREARRAAALMAFFLIFDIPASVIPLASDLLMLAPHIAAVWLAWKGRAFWSGALAGVAALFNPKGLFILLACAIWNTGGWVAMAAGFALPLAAAAAWLGAAGALGAAYEQVWEWGRVYAGGTFVSDPVANGIRRTFNWMGFHGALVLGAAAMWARERRERWRWAAWAAVSFAAVAMGWRFFPRYFFQLLPVVVLAGARGLAAGAPAAPGDGGRGVGDGGAPARAPLYYWAALALLVVPAVRFGPRYVQLAAGGAAWADVAMDSDSREAARLLEVSGARGETLFVWGFRPELYAYTRMTAGSRFLDSQPLTGVPADRHLTQAEAVETEAPRAHRAELARSAPAWVVDGLGPYNPRLAITRYPDLAAWMARYREVARTRGAVIYRRIDSSTGTSQGFRRPAGPLQSGADEARSPFRAERMRRRGRAGGRVVGIVRDAGDGRPAVRRFRRLEFSRAGGSHASDRDGAERVRRFRIL